MYGYGGGKGQGGYHQPAGNGYYSYPQGGQAPQTPWYGPQGYAAPVPQPGPGQWQATGATWQPHSGQQWYPAGQQHYGAQEGSYQQPQQGPAHQQPPQHQKTPSPLSTSVPHKRAEYAASDWKKGGAEPVCATCGVAIGDHDCVQSGDKFWHESCFRCYKCTLVINEMKFKELDDGRLCCRDCALPRCDACGKKLDGYRIKAEGKQFHMSCFKCQKCAKEIRDYTMIGGEFWCNGCAKNHCYCCALPIGTDYTYFLRDDGLLCEYCKKGVRRSQALREKEARAANFKALVEFDPEADFEESKYGGWEQGGGNKKGVGKGSATAGTQTSPSATGAKENPVPTFDPDADLDLGYDGWSNSSRSPVNHDGPLPSFANRVGSPGAAPAPRAPQAPALNLPNVPAFDPFAKEVGERNPYKEAREFQGGHHHKHRHHQG